MVLVYLFVVATSLVAGFSALSSWDDRRIARKMKSQ